MVFASFVFGMNQIFFFGFFAHQKEKKRSVTANKSHIDMKVKTHQAFSYKLGS